MNQQCGCNHADSFAVWVGAVCGGGVGLITMLGVMPFLMKRIEARFAAEEQ